MARLPKPSVLPEASSRLRLGRPEEFPPGSARRFPEQNVFLFGDSEGIYAISAVCPHLGCIVSRDADEHFDCPCHGSRFGPSGAVLGGPAPSGLSWLEVSRAPNGLLYVDTSRSVSAGTKWRRA